MVKRTQQAAGMTRKTHRTRKTEPQTPGSGSSSTALVAAPPLVPPTPPTEKPAERETPRPVAVVLVPAENPAVQWWYRPKDSKTRKLVEKVMVLRAAGHKDPAIAKRLHTTPGSIHQAVYVARKNKWLDEDDEPVDLEAELAMSVDRKIVRNIGASLDGNMTNWQTHEMTIAAAKGRGVFKNHEVNKGDGSAPMSVVAIQVVMPNVGAGDQMPEVHEDQMGGVPAYFADIETDIQKAEG